MQVTPTGISWIANSFVVLSLVFQERGWIYLVFPIGVIISILWLVYGVLIDDMSFVWSNAVFFIPFNLYGSYKWILKHIRKEVVKA